MLAIFIQLALVSAWSTISMSPSFKYLGTKAEYKFSINGNGSYHVVKPIFRQVLADISNAVTFSHDPFKHPLTLYVAHDFSIANITNPKAPLKVAFKSDKKLLKAPSFMTYKFSPDTMLEMRPKSSILVIKGKRFNVDYHANGFSVSRDDHDSVASATFKTLTCRKCDADGVKAKRQFVSPILCCLTLADDVRHAIRRHWSINYDETEMTYAVLVGIAYINSFGATLNKGDETIVRNI